MKRNRRRRVSVGLETLEARRLLAAVAWTGAGDGTNWTSAANWSNNAVPTAADDVTVNVASNPNIVIASGAQSVHSLTNAENLAINGGSLSVGTTASSSAPITANGGAINGGSWAFGPGAAFNIGAANGSSFNNAGISGDLLFNVDNAHAVVSGTTTFTTARLMNNGTSIGCAPGYVLSSAVSMEGAGTSGRYVEMNGTAGTLTIGAGGSIRTAAGFAGTGNVGASFWFGGAMTLNNGGTISSETSGRTVNVFSANYTNSGTLRATGGGVVAVLSGSIYTNSGTFDAAGGNINLAGTWNTGGGTGTVTSSGGGTINLGGTLNNTGNTITLNATTGSWNLAGGTISGGALSFAGGATLGLTSTGGILNNVTVNGDLSFAASNAHVQIAGGTTFATAHLVADGSSIGFAPGSTLNGTVLFEGAGASSRHVEMNGTAGSLTIGAGGAIRTTAGFAGTANIGSSFWFGGAMTLNNGGTISSETSGRTLNIVAANFSNTGSTSVSNGAALQMQPVGAYANAGTFTVNGGTLNLAGTFNTTGGIGAFSRTGGTVNVTGTISNAGNNLTLSNATGTWNLLGGTVNGGQLSFADGQSLTYTSSGGILNNVTVNGDLPFSVSNAHVQIAGSTTFATAHLSANGTSIGFAPGYTLNGAVLFEGADASGRYVEMNGSAGTLTIGAGGAIRTTAGFGGTANIGSSFWFGGAMTLNNGGTISAETSGRTVNIAPATFNNNAGTSVSNGATIEMLPTNAYSNAGTFTINNGTLNLRGTFNTTGGIGAFSRTGGTVNVIGTLNNTGNNLTLSNVTGTWNLLGGTVNGGQLSFADGQSLTYTSSGGILNNVTVNGDLPFTVINAHVQVAGTTTFGTAHLAADGASIGFAPGYTLNSTVLFESGGTGSRNVEMNGTAGSLTIGATGSIRTTAGFSGAANIGTSFWFGGAMTLNNNGTISSETSGRQVAILATNFNNTGNTSVSNGGVLQMQPTNAYANAGTFTINGGTLNLAGTFNTTAGIGTFARTGGTVNVTGTVTNSGNTITLNNSTGTWNLVGGTVGGGQLSFANGQTLALTSSGGIINNVQVNGDLSAAVGNAHVQIAGNTTFANFHLGGDGSSVGFVPGYTLSGNVLFEGSGTSSRHVEMNGTAGVLVIAPGGSIRSVAGFAGVGSIGDSFWFGGAMTLTDNGLISAEAAGRVITLNNNSTFTVGATGVTQAINGGLLNVDGTGNTVVNAGGNASVSRFRQTDLTVNGNAAVAPNGAAAQSSVLKSITINGSAKFDLNDNDLILDYTGATQLAAIQNLINAARTGGTWNGNGITSSSARNNANHSTTLGAMEATDYWALHGNNASFDGNATDNTMVLVKYTWYGDTDFNGVVNFDDYVRTDNGFNNHLSGWRNGDFDANSAVNFDDYVLIDLAFNTQSGAL